MAKYEPLVLFKLFWITTLHTGLQLSLVYPLPAPWLRKCQVLQNNQVQANLNKLLRVTKKTKNNTLLTINRYRGGTQLLSQGLCARGHLVFDSSWQGQDLKSVEIFSPKKKIKLLIYLVFSCILVLLLSLILQQPPINYHASAPSSSRQLYYTLSRYHGICESGNKKCSLEKRQG